MKIRNLAGFIILFILFFTGIIVYSLNDLSEDKMDVTAVNDIAETLAEQWDKLGQGELPCQEYGLPYSVIDENDNLIAASEDGLNCDINSAIRNRDTIADIIQNGRVLGKLIIHNNTDNILKQRRRNLFFIFESGFILAAVLCVVYTIYIDRSVLKPFRKLKAFARHVAAGNLDMPLEMDRGNRFGVFTESFDLMRDELNKARENERAANQSKKELVASLSHDIKTPVASIKAVSEIMSVKTKDVEEKEQLEIITDKANQINALITNMFNATLEELQELKVNATEQSSQKLFDQIKNSDYYNKVTVHGIPECIIIEDELRLSQVIDNIISNSYKYAGTAIEVSGIIKGQYLEITFRDFGKGVSEEEKPLLFSKFYRAKNASGKNGAGLGLYISKYLMTRMSGDIECDNLRDGFVIKLKLLLA